MRTRLILDSVCLVSVIFFPFWISLILMTLTCVRFRAIEIMFLGLFMNFLWYPATPWYAIPWFILFGIGIVWILEPVRAELLTS